MTEAAKTEAGERRRVRRKRIRWRPWIRAIHRDIGYLAVGLTFVYALSGLAVNHIADWDPNFTQIERHHSVEIADPAAAEAALSEAILRQLDVGEEPSDVYRPTPDSLEIALDSSTLYVDLNSGEIREEGQESRFFLRAANWLHLNRGKKAWTYVADAYAFFLLYLAVSGMFMLPGRKGLLGRGAFFVAAGALVPIAYVLMSGPG
jgi:hypothetical protein